MRYVIRYLVSLIVVVALWLALGTFTYWNLDWARVWEWDPYSRGGLIGMILMIAGLGAMCPAWDWRK